MQSLSREELSEWQAFWQLEPFGSQFDEYRSALIASVVAEVNRNRKKRGKAFTPKEFMPEWGKDEPKKDQPQSGMDMFEFVKGVQREMEKNAGMAPQMVDEQPLLYDPHGNPLTHDAKE